MKAEIKVVRDLYGEDYTIGTISINGKDFGHTLEDVVRHPEAPKVYGKTAISAGTYKVIVSRSNRFSKLAGKDVYMPELLNVPNFLGVRIHTGNKPEDTEGCILLGKVRSNGFVGQSRVAYTAFMEELKKYTEYEITIIDTKDVNSLPLV